MRRTLCIVLLVNLARGFVFPNEELDEDLGCGEGEQCVAPAHCPEALTDLTESHLRPRICSYHSRSLAICCKREKMVAQLADQRCGVRRDVRSLSVAPEHLNTNLTEAELLEILTFNEIFALNVIGGEEAEKHTHPWMAALGSRGPDGSSYWFCGGSYLGENLVLTAAHCIPSASVDLIVRLGAHNLALASEAGAEDFKVRKIVVHPQYTSGLIHTHDIALVLLDTPEGEISRRPEVSPICLPSPGYRLPPGAPLTVAGWGSRQERGDKPDRLHEVTVTLYPHSQCAGSYRALTGLEIGQEVLCAGEPRGGRDACSGDSGGALIHQDLATGSWSVVGVVSAGHGCGRAGYPGLYSRLSSYRDWLEEVRRNILVSDI